MPTLGVFAAVLDEDRRILCVRRAYGDHAWTLPGGGVEPGEAPLAALVREVREETGYTVEPGDLVGVYVMPWKDDLVLCVRATIVARGTWAADGEIAEIGFFAAGALPEPFSRRARGRIADLFSDAPARIRVVDPD